MEKPDTATGLIFPVSFAGQVADFERDLLTQALKQAGNRQTEAATLLELGYHQFRRLLKKYNL